MNISLKNKQVWRVILIVFIAHTALALINFPQSYYVNSQRPQPAGLLRFTLMLSWQYYSWALITPFVLWFGYRFRIAKPNLYRNIFLHLIASVLTGVANLFVYGLGVWIVGWGSLDYVRTLFFTPVNYIGTITGAIVHYPSIIAIQSAYLYFRESRERAFRLQEAELQLLKMQIHPHFFFNTLNAISAQIYRAPEKADDMITQLGDMFRFALRKDKAQEIPLKDELEFLKAFLQIHQTLMGKRLRVEWKIDAETLHALVPNLILQPLAENAIQHGLAPLEQGGCLVIGSNRREDEKLVIQIGDDGQGWTSANGKDSGGSGNNGIGLSNTRARLESLYHERHKFLIDEPAGGGVTVRIEIPFREN